MPTLFDVHPHVGRAQHCLHFVRAFQAPCSTAVRSRPSEKCLLRTQASPRDSLQSAPQWHSSVSCRHQRRRSTQRLQTNALFGGLFRGDLAEKTRKRFQPQVDKINALEPEMKKLSDDELRSRTTKLQNRCREGETLDSLLVETFAVRLPTWSWLKLVGA